MKKSLIALAVAGAFAAPAFAATSNVDIYGQFMVSVDFADTDVANGSDMVTGRDNASRVGLKGSEDLGGGLKAVWQVESQLGFNPAGTDAANPTGGLAGRNTFVGLAGGFGTVIVGKHDTPYKLATGKLDPFSDTAGDYNNIISRSATTAAGSLFDLRVDGTIAYITPTFSGFHAAVAYVQPKNVEAAGTDERRHWSLMGMYENGPLFASLAFENHAGVGAVGASTTEEADAWKLGLGYSFGDAKVGFVWEDIDGAGTTHDRDAWYINGVYNMGPIALKAAYGTADETSSSANDGADFWAVGLDYNLSKRTSAFILYTAMDNDASASYSFAYAPAAAGGDPDVWSIGLKHTF